MKERGRENGREEKRRRMLFSCVDFEIVMLLFIGLSQANNGNSV